ncbi:MAG: hypothetical protein J7L69_07835 [Desulfobulbaceae bacterium]|nr:hypothetical protein [Desulfobulbaceae bacterium]
MRSESTFGKFRTLVHDVHVLMVTEQAISLPGCLSNNADTLQVAHALIDRRCREAGFLNQPACSGNQVLHQRPEYQQYGFCWTAKSSNFVLILI